MPSSTKGRGVDAVRHEAIHSSHGWRSGQRRNSRVCCPGPRLPATISPAAAKRSPWAGSPIYRTPVHPLPEVFRRESGGGFGLFLNSGADERHR
jgi:hypothetical protein